MIKDTLKEAGLDEEFFTALKNGSVGLVMLYELLFGRGNIQGGGKLKRHVMYYSKALFDALEQLRERAGLLEGAPHELLLPPEVRRTVSWPRYVRVNTLRISQDGAMRKLKLMGLNPEEDVHIPGLLKLPSGTDLHDCDLVLSGCLVLQDKSSCFSSFALMDGKEWVGGDVLDGFAAPGNKTSHLAALVGPSGGRVFAMEKDSKRAEVLRQRCATMGGTVDIENGNFFESKPDDKRYCSLQAILIDPSCSGSGLVTTPDRAGEMPLLEDNPRAVKLSEFQLRALLHAMSFSQVNRIVYSTCSVLEVENEGVVADALRKRDDWVLSKCLPQWDRRGRHTRGLSVDQADCLVRVEPSLGDETNGFFVALFIRRDTISGSGTKRVAVSQPSTGYEESGGMPRKQHHRKKKRRKGRP